MDYDHPHRQLASQRRHAVAPSFSREARSTTYLMGWRSDAICAGPRSQLLAPALGDAVCRVAPLQRSSPSSRRRGARARAPTSKRGARATGRHNLAVPTSPAGRRRFADEVGGAAEAGVGPWSRGESMQPPVAAEHLELRRWSRAGLP
jgi:hypothetical protein